MATLEPRSLLENVDMEVALRSLPQRPRRTEPSSIASAAVPGLVAGMLVWLALRALHGRAPARPAH
jgi:hypothetical protein